ncbi:MAG: IS1 family transposase [Gammaproteobacteria bacterium]|nr:IS1 family transposase [Gammaproteobacteria bacterium]
MNRLPLERRAHLLALLVEGSSLRSASRIANVSINTVSKLLVDVGKAARSYQDEKLRGLQCKRIQCDEIWSFCYAKQKNVPEKMKGQPGVGDVWTWTAMDADSKLVISWLVGERDAGYATEFISDLASRLATRVQLTTDGLKVYLEAVEGAFGADIDFAQLVKLFGEAPEQQKRYSPAQCTGCRKTRIEGHPDPRHVSTSFVERLNLTTRMSMRRFTRLTNAFSKKIENHEHAIAIHYMHYNFGRIHKSLRVTPAMAADVTDHVWSLEEIASLAN